jgi:hypothetical protein
VKEQTTFYRDNEASSKSSVLLTTKFLRFCIPESFAVWIVTGLNVEAEVEVDHDPDVVALMMAAYVVTVTIPSADLVNLKPIALILY